MNLEKYKNDFVLDGFISPVSIISENEARTHRELLENAEKKLGNMHYQSKIHTIFRSAFELATHPNILDIIKKIIGPNILLHNTTYIIKEAKSQSFVSWHQDLPYWGFSSDDQVSVWLALSTANDLSGAMYMIPGSHKNGMKKHVCVKNKTNVLSQNQSIENVDENKKILCGLKPGEASFHHGWTVHSSMPNNSNDRRIGFNIQYVATHMKQEKNKEDTAICVSGEDNYNYYKEDIIAKNDNLDDIKIQRMKNLTKKYLSVVSSKN